MIFFDIPWGISLIGLFLNLSEIKLTSSKISTGKICEINKNIQSVFEKRQEIDLPILEFLVKGADTPTVNNRELSRYFRTAMKSQKITLHQWKPKNNGQVL